MDIKAIIFDLDGTLLNTIDDLADSMNQVLKESGFPVHDVDEYLYFVGNGARILVERALPEDQRDSSSIDKYLIRYRENYRNNWNNKTLPYAGIDIMLAKLKPLGLTLAILSNKPHNDVLKCTSYYFDETIFSSIAGQKDSVPHKPAPDGALIIAKELRLQPENCLFVGDSSVDMKTAKAAGMIAVGVSWGFRIREELLENGADYIIDSPEELLGLV